jgi:hypothetical protein
MRDNTTVIYRSRARLPLFSGRAIMFGFEQRRPARLDYSAHMREEEEMTGNENEFVKSGRRNRTRKNLDDSLNIKSLGNPVPRPAAIARAQREPWRRK